jgi:hypothetical protein
MGETVVVQLTADEPVAASAFARALRLEDGRWQVVATNQK